ncbi:hypothetical protein [Antribacter gilvus]|uniref:hypothetical protein n=1 Tax=Antribacter gilvus TaxID=2304675 RepID=UPI000F774F36|nr:hypothetical protein [Antribacter gilvus]
MSFPARYRGACGACDEPIEPGQDVEYGDLEFHREIVHAVCPDPVRYEAPVCPGCNLTLPCECEDD